MLLEEVNLQSCEDFTFLDFSAAHVARSFPPQSHRHQHQTAQNAEIFTVAEELTMAANSQENTSQQDALADKTMRKLTNEHAAVRQALSIEKETSEQFRANSAEWYSHLQTLQLDLTNKIAVLEKEAANWRGMTDKLSLTVTALQSEGRRKDEIISASDREKEARRAQNEQHEQQVTNDSAVLHSLQEWNQILMKCDN